MGAPKKYIRNQFRVNKIALRHEDASDFYLGSWQSGRSPVPLLFIRLIIFLGCVGILTSCVTVMGQSIELKYWPIYLTHWGVIMITVASGLAFLVSVIATINGQIDTSNDLPWYVKLYWVWYCISVPTAFFITIFYFSLLAGVEEEYAVDPILDIFIHGINSVMMLCLMATTRHPIYLLQFLYPLLFNITYLGFCIVYYYAGGISATGDSWIYPMLDWSEPGIATAVVFGCAFFLLIIHIAVMGLSALRDYLVRRYVFKFNSVNIN